MRSLTCRQTMAETRHSSDAGMVLKPGSTIGIFGGGQLGRMLALAAAPLGLKCHIYCPDPQSPAFDVAAATTIAAYDDERALDRFAASVDAVTYEFENIDLAAVERLADLVPVRPAARALTVSQDRLAEKTFLRDAGIAVAPFAAVDVLSLVVPRQKHPRDWQSQKKRLDEPGSLRVLPDKVTLEMWHEDVTGAHPFDQAIDRVVCSVTRDRIG